ncbi:MAG: translational GTPase TypA [Bdellovibrionales bacterium]|nr:translational GTPase TypA [Bdellovibrionales bacterium]
MDNIRNICIIAHVDHGKTTLVDHLLRQSGTFSERAQVEERVMDSMDLERERGITIQAKNAAIQYKETRINIVDTPGHADFGGEVERILGMVDGAVLLVDAAEGPLPQTRFVLQKALERGHKIILCVNKVDRPECKDGIRTKEVVNQAFDLFIDLGASEEQADFPIVYACAREGWCTTDPDEVPALIAKEKKGSLQPLFDLIVKTIPPPSKGTEDSFQMMVANIGWSDFVGRLAIGRIKSGALEVGQRAYRLGVDDTLKETTEGFNVSKLFRFSGLSMTDVKRLEAGDVGVVAGSENFEIGDTVAGTETTARQARIEVNKPSLSMIFSVNTAPFSGRDGDAVQSRKLRERLLREVRHNVAVKFEDTGSPDQFRVLGRGELQFAILIEQMRREGSEFMVGRPEVLIRQGEGGKEEPLERATLDLPEEFASDVTRMFQERKGILMSYEVVGTHSGPSGSQNRIRLEFEIPTRGLLGMRTKYLTATKGEGLFASQLIGYTPWKGEMLHRLNGALIADRDGYCTEYALINLDDRGLMFVKPGVEVYEGMIIGEFNKENDLNVNPCREKKLTNVRAAGSDHYVALKGIREMTLERCIEWIEQDEWIEVTPKTIRMRKKVLKGNQRSIVRRSDDED